MIVRASQCLLLTISFLAALLLVSPAHALPIGGTVSRGLAVDGLNRSYLLHRPPFALLGVPRPLLVVLHGGTENSRKVLEETDFNDYADTRGFYVAYPDAVGGIWNDGRDNPEQPQESKGINDVAFISRLIDELVAKHNIDRARVYVSGPSNGGMMTYRVGCELAGKIAGIAPVIASMPANYSCVPSRPLPIIMINGTADPLMPFEGGSIRGIGNEYRGTVIGIPATVKFWSILNRCRDVTVTNVLPDRDPLNPVQVEAVRRTCKQPVLEINALGAGHRWYGGYAPLIENLLTKLFGYSTKDVSSSREIVKFFEL